MCQWAAPRKFFSRCQYVFTRYVYIIEAKYGRYGKMTQTRKRFLALFMSSLVLCTVLLFPLREAHARYDNTSSCAALMSFSGNTAYCTASVIGKNGTSSITGTMTLYRKATGSSSGYSMLKSWPVSGGSYLLQEKTYSPATSGYTYYLTLDASVTRNGTTEDIYCSTTVNH